MVRRVIGILTLVCALLVMASCSSAKTDGTAAATNSTSNSPSSTSQSTSGPSRSATATKGQLTGAEIAAGALKASQSVQSLAFDMDFSMSLDLPTMGTMTMVQTGTGSINAAAKQMDLNMTIAMDIPKQGKQSGTGEIIMIDGWLYTKMSVPGTADQWTKMKLTDEMWAAQSRFSSVSDFLKSPVGVEVIGSETIRGVDCYVLSVTPDMNALSSWVASQAQSGQTSAAAATSGLAESMKNFSVKEWVAKDSLLPLKAVVSVNLDSAGATPTVGTAMKMAMAMDVSMMFRDYGKTVNIQLPAEALNAKELVTRDQ